MHELGIMYHIVKQVLTVVEENDVEEVEAIVLQVGELSSVIPKYLKDCFPAAVDGTILKDTQLEIETLPANGLCKVCDKVFNVIEYNKQCPHCEGKEYELLTGREFFLKEIRVC